MTLFQHLARGIIERSFHLSVTLIEQFKDITIYEQKVLSLAEFPEGSLARDIATCLQRNRLRLVPGYESHDLKHVLLGFKMTPADEIRMQAFMLGNGNFSIPSLGIFVFGAILLPDLWKTFYVDYKRGKNVAPIKEWTIEAYGHYQTSELRQIIVGYSGKPQK